MNKQEFFEELTLRLDSLPKSEIQKSIAYYEEIIDDRIEDGMTEDNAIKALGHVDDIAQNIMYDLSIPQLMKAKVNVSKKNASNKRLWLTLAILGSPFWLPVLLAFALTVFSLYLTVWSVIVSLYSVIIALGISCLSGIIVGIAFLFVKSVPVGLCYIGAGICCGALTLFIVKAVNLSTKKLVKFSAHIIRKVKSLFITKKGSL